MRKPAILNFATLKNPAHEQKPFFYDPSSNLNMIEHKGIKMPFVDCEPSSALELYTKTEVQREEDEEHDLVELVTKTEQAREVDD